LQLHALGPQLIRRSGIGYVRQGRPQEVSQRGPEAERHDRQAGDQDHHGPRRPVRVRGGQNVIGDLAEHAEHE
jgi:hypothetical protein